VLFGCCLPTLRNNVPVPFSRVYQPKINGKQRKIPLFSRRWSVWVLVLEDGKWPARVLERDVATGISRETNNTGNVRVMKH
jgi:hypothetical protein